MEKRPELLSGIHRTEASINFVQHLIDNEILPRVTNADITLVGSKTGLSTLDNQPSWISQIKFADAARNLSHDEANQLFIDLHNTAVEQQINPSQLHTLLDTTSIFPSLDETPPELEPVIEAVEQGIASDFDLLVNTQRPAGLQHSYTDEVSHTTVDVICSDDKLKEE